MKFALCNEMFGKTELESVCSTARELGYDAIEIAPFTLANSAYDLSDQDLDMIRVTVEDQGLRVLGLHWLFTGQGDLHTTSPDERLRRNAHDYFLELIRICHRLGGELLVIGSPKHRNIAPGQSPEMCWERARDLYISVLEEAGEYDVDLCLEPLAPEETNFINSVEEGLRMVDEIDHPNFKIHLDIKAMSYESEAIDTIIRKVPIEKLGHVHVNDPNLYGPGMGEVDYAPIAAALKEIGWDRWLSVEVFRFDPDPVSIAKRSIDYLHRFWPNRDQLQTRT